MRISDWSSDVCSSDLLNTFLPIKFSTGFQFAFTGSPLASLTLLIPTFVLAVSSIVKSKNWKSNVFEIAASILIGLGIALHIFSIGRASGRERVFQYV